MVKAPRLTAKQAEKMLLAAGFQMLRAKGSHRIYKKGGLRIIVPFHPRKLLHPKVIKQILKSIEGGEGGDKKRS